MQANTHTYQRVTGEKRMSLKQAARDPRFRRPDGSPLHYGSLIRYATSGAAGVILETVKIGGFRFTSSQAIDRFIARLNGAAEAELENAPPSHDQAVAELAAAGI